MAANSFKIAVLSGKGGTGKTFVSVNLAYVFNEVSYIDCDVEEPNGHLFFKVLSPIEEKVNVDIPMFDNNKCNGCRKCIDFCKFNALAFINNRVKVFEDICHSCGGCKIVCSEKAVSESKKSIGKIVSGSYEHIKVFSGVLNEGEKTGVPIINKLLSTKFDTDAAIIDCPPGSACTVMESIKDADYCIIVAEPTLFGIHNFEMVFELISLFDKKYGIIINKSSFDNPMCDFFINYNVIGKIPFDKEVARLNSEGEIVTKVSSKYKEIFSNILQTIVEGENI